MNDQDVEMAVTPNVSANPFRAALTEVVGARRPIGEVVKQMVIAGVLGIALGEGANIVYHQLAANPHLAGEFAQLVSRLPMELNLPMLGRQPVDLAILGAGFASGLGIYTSGLMGASRRTGR